MKQIEKFGWFIIAYIVIVIAVIALTYFGSDIASAYGMVLSLFVAVMFAEIMSLVKK